MSRSASQKPAEIISNVHCSSGSGQALITEGLPKPRLGGYRCGIQAKKNSRTRV